MTHNYSNIEKQNQFLIRENQILKNKAKKVNQIQAYVNILIQSSENYQKQIGKLNLENRQLKNQIDQVMGENIRLETLYQNEFTNMENQFKRLLNKKQEQIKNLSIIREKDLYNFQQTLIDSQNRSKQDIQRMKLQINHIQSEYEFEIKKLTTHLKQKSKQTSLLNEQKNQLKRLYNEQANSYNCQMEQIQRNLSQSQNQILMLNEEKLKLNKMLKQFQEMYQRLEHTFQLKSEQLFTIRKKLQTQISVLQSSNNDLKAQQLKFQHKWNQSLNEIEHLRKNLNSSNNEIGESKKRQNLLQKCLNQIQQEFTSLTIKSQIESQQHCRISKRQAEHLKRVEDEFSIINQNYVIEKQLARSKTIQIQDLIMIIDKLELDLNQQQKQNRLIESENHVLLKQIEMLTRQTRDKEGELNIYHDKYIKLDENFIILQDQSNKYQKRLKHLQLQNKDLTQKIQTTKNQYFLIYQQQKQRLLQNHLKQKRQLLQTHKFDKQNIIKRSEQDLRQKDLQAKKRLQLLEDEINLFRVRH